MQESFLDEGFILDKRIGIGQPRRIENAKILVANTPMDTDKIKIYGARVRVDSMSKVSLPSQSEEGQGQWLHQFISMRQSFAGADVGHVPAWAGMCLCLPTPSAKLFAKMCPCRCFFSRHGFTAWQLFAVAARAQPLLKASPALPGHKSSCSIPVWMHKLLSPWHWAGMALPTAR